jgi:hypothetical protein
VEQLDVSLVSTAVGRWFKDSSGKRQRLTVKPDQTAVNLLWRYLLLRSVLPGSPLAGKPSACSYPMLSNGTLGKFAVFSDCGKAGWPSNDVRIGE